jgi:TonB family protein
MTSAAASLTAPSHTSTAYPALCRRLLNRAKVFYPETSVSCEAPPVAIETAGMGQLDEKAKITKRVSPKYPRAAEQQRIYGKVRFRGVIGADGKIGSLDLIRGPLPLFGAARDAVQRWEFSPATHNGQAVASVRTLDVDFVLQD